jgi:hypothetical protein
MADPAGERAYRRPRVCLFAITLTAIVMLIVVAVLV